MTHIYQVNECDWVAAESLAKAAEFYVNYCGEEIDHDEAYELGDEELDTKRYCVVEGEDHGLAPGKYSFSQVLDAMLNVGYTPPFLFASTEQ